MRKHLLPLVCLALAPLAGCVAGGSAGLPGGGDDLGGEGWKEDSSVEATFLEFEFDGSLVTQSDFGVRSQLQNQLLYTIGQLNGENSVGRLDNIQITDLVTTELEAGGFESTYHAKLLVAWGKRNAVPTTYELVLPKDASADGLSAFTAKYKSQCTDLFAHDVDVDSMWYYYRPNDCEIEAADVVRASATVTQSAIETTGKFPEYDKVWEDGVLRVVSVFGKYESGATEPSDPGVSAYRNFVRAALDAVQASQPTTVPAELPETLGVETPEVTITAHLADGHDVEIVGILVNSVGTAGASFYDRYRALSQRADFIAYTGHSDLGNNIRTLSREGDWVEGQYVVVMMNGCDTYAYVDSALATAHTRVNPNDDPNGTKYLDLVMNAMPSPARTGHEPPMAIVNGLLRYDAPRTYQEMFRDITSSQVVLVSGEQDNTYTPTP